jgi:anti-sigma-K factor RskA
VTDDRETHMLTGAYALGAVDDLEAARVRELLRTSPEAAAEVRSFTETAARLGAAEAVEPPPGMRAAVLAQVAQTRQAPPITVPKHTASTRLARLVSVAAAALLVVALGAGVTALTFRDRASDAEAANQAMTEVLADPDRQVVDADFAGGHATLVVSGERVVVLGTDVPAPPEGKAYQLWMIPDGEGAEPIPSVTLTPTGDGEFWADTTGYEAGQAMAVTVEPEGGSQQPTSDPLFVAGA